MNDGKITVGVVSWYSTDQIKDLFASLTNNATHPDLIEFVICDNTGGKDTRLSDTFDSYYKILPFTPIIPKTWKPQRATGSYAHGLGLNILMSQIQTEYCLFSDPDCIVLIKGWDIRLKSMLDDKHIASGAPYHSSKITKYHNFPSPIFSFFNVQAYKDINADWIPYHLPLTTLMTDQIRRISAIIGGYMGERIWGGSFYLSITAKILRQLFGNSSKDTGWRIASSAIEKGYAAHLLTTAVVQNQLAPSLLGNKTIIDLMTEYELFLLDGIPFVTHLYSTKHRSKGSLDDADRRWKMLALSASDFLNNTEH